MNFDIQDSYVVVSHLVELRKSLKFNYLFT